MFRRRDREPKESQETEKKLRKCIACNTEYDMTGLKICPKDGHPLVTPQPESQTWQSLSKRAKLSKYCTSCKATYHKMSDTHCPQHGLALTSPPGPIEPAPILEDRFQLIEFNCEDDLFDKFTARDVQDQKIVAVKFILPHLCDTQTVSRFQKLAQPAMGLQHPAIVSIYSVNTTTDDAPYLVTDHVVANSLNNEIQARKYLDVATAANVFISILEALQYAHDREVVHGAISCSNLLMSGGSGQSARGLLDNFGVAERLFRELKWEQPSTDTRTANIYGNANCASPESCAGLRPTASTDIYQIGCALYETVSGRPPFTREAPMQTLLAHMMDEPDDIQKHNNSVSDQLKAVVYKCLEKGPENRYQSAKELAVALEQFK